MEDRLIPPADSGGWRLRMRNGLKDVVQYIVDNDLPEIKEEYPSLKGGKNSLLKTAKDELRKNGTAMFEKDSMVMLFFASSSPYFLHNNTI